MSRSGPASRRRLRQDALTPAEKAARDASIRGMGEVFAGKLVKGKVVMMNKKAWGGEIQEVCAALVPREVARHGRPLSLGTTT